MKEDELEVDVEEDLPWIQEKALDLVEFTGTVTQAIPGPRVGQSSFPWILAIPLAYLGVTFVIAFVKTVRKFNSPKEKRRQLVSPSILLFLFNFLVHFAPSFCLTNFRHSAKHMGKIFSFYLIFSRVPLT